MFEPPSSSSNITTTTTSPYYNMDTTPSTSSSSKTSPHQVPRLTDLCKRVLKANVAHIVDVGDVPFEMVKDILFGCRVEQLREIEELSPHIAEEDEEIWEYFFKRDFPIVAEARAKATSAAEASQKSALCINATQTNKSPSKPISSNTTSNHTTNRADSEAEEHDDDDLFISYRDLYYDEQVRREEKLASAGERLKERMSNLAAMKSSRQTILDPRLSLNLRKKRRGQITLPTGRRGAVPWGSSRPKTLTEKARAKASQLAFAYEPPRSRFTRSASMQVGFIPPRARPVYKEDSLEELQPGQSGQATKGIFGPRRDRTMSSGSSTSNSASGTSMNASHPSRTSFVERTVSRPAKSSMERPHKVLQLPEKGHISKTITRSPSPVKSVQDDTAKSPSIPETTPAFVFKSIPGITRRPLPAKMIEKQALEAKIAQESAVSAASSPPAYSPPPMSTTSTTSSTMTTMSSSSADLPMLSQPPRRLPPGPSLFIPRKKPKIK